MAELVQRTAEAGAALRAQREAEPGGGKEALRRVQEHVDRLQRVRPRAVAAAYRASQRGGRLLVAQDASQVQTELRGRGKEVRLQSARAWLCVA